MKGFWSVFGIPLLIAAVTVFGLIAALWEAWRWASWIALAAPLVVIAVRVFRPVGGKRPATLP